MAGVAKGPGSRAGAKRKPRGPALPVCLTIREVTAARRQLQRALAAGATAIDASAIALIDTAGLQLLLAAGTGGRLRYVAPSRALCVAARQLGLGVALGLEAGRPVSSETEPAA